MKIFICYDKKQKKYFEEHGFKDIIYGLHPKSLKPFWCFERNESFDKCFNEWLSN